MGQSTLREARTAIRNRNPELAAHHAKRLLVDSPGQLDGLRILFQAAVQLGRADDACIAGYRILEAEPRDMATRIDLARFELAGKRPEKSIALLRQFAHGERAAIAILAAAYEQVGKATLAGSLRLLVSSGEHSIGATAGHDDARRYFASQLARMLSERSPGTTESAALSKALLANRYSDAEGLFQQWLLKCTDSDTSGLALADWFLFIGNPSAAAQALERVQGSSAVSAAIHNRLGDIAQLRRDLQAARHHYRKATILDASDHNAWLDLARTEFLMGDISAARDACEAVLHSEVAEQEDLWLASEFLRELRDEVSTQGMGPGLYGLVWWERGGGVLEVEARARAEEEGLMITGNVGEGLTDASRVAYAFIRERFGCFQNSGVHVHFPDYRTPKDGGSAGALVALLLLGVAHKEHVTESIAVTGELSLNGRIYPVGGIREKITAAHLHGVDRVYLPAKNSIDLLEVPLAAKRSLQLVNVGNFEDLLDDLQW